MNIDVDSVLQSQAEETFAKIGLPLSEAVNLFLKAAVRYGGLPFEDKLECYNDDTRRALKDEELIGPFDTVAELMGALNAED